MADIEEKEELTNQEVSSPDKASTEEKVEEYFNPFADISDEDQEIEKEIKEEKVEEKAEPVKADTDDTVIKGQLAEIKAQTQASREVGKFLKDNPEFADMGDDLIDLASKASVRGHSKPLEFALRNVKHPSYWIEYGKKLGRNDFHEVSQNRVGGASLSKTEGKGTPDFDKMTPQEFNEYARSVKNGA
jgi:hypothetical protein